MLKHTQLTSTFFCVFFLFFCCKKKESCPKQIELGQLNWSAETQAWFPPKYLSQPATLEFESENGEILQFNLDYSKFLEGIWNRFDMVCKDDEGVTEVSWHDRRYTGRFITPDSLAISVGIGVWNESLGLYGASEADFYEWVSISVYRLHAGPGFSIGKIRIVTDLRNAELADIDHTPEYYKKHENFEFMGTVYPEIYCDDVPDSPNTNIYFEKEKGLIGFIDKDGTKWRLKE